MALFRRKINTDISSPREEELERALQKKDIADIKFHKTVNNPCDFTVIEELLQSLAKGKHNRGPHHG